MTAKACVIGWPIGHSRSPIIHNFWLRKYGIDGVYERVPVEPRELEKFIGALAGNGYRGCNVTIPHKETVFRLVQPSDDTSRRLGAINTVFIRDGRTFGTNTDGEGFLANLRSNAPSLSIKGIRAFVVGAGGAATAIVNALLEAEAADVVVCNRTPERSESLRERFGSRVSVWDWDRRSDGLTETALLVNTTALGMAGQAPLDLDLNRLPSNAVVTDIVYTPLTTQLLAMAKERGNPTVDGLGMLLHQAVRGFQLWFEVRPEVTGELYDLVAQTIEPARRQ